MNHLFSNQVIRIVTLFVMCCSSNLSNCQDEMVEIENFGSNPGNLKMYVYRPSSIGRGEKIPLVVALHGCSQNADKMARESGWNTLADKHHFMVIYPEQKRINNTSNCFNWFMTKDSDTDNGETASILQMINFTQANYTIDSNETFIYGLSAGAAMAVSVVVNSPCKFSSGAILAGGPYGYATNAVKGFKMMLNPPDKTGMEWGALLPDEEIMNCKPRLVIVHGTEDKIVDIRNSMELIDQWCFIHETNSSKSKVFESSITNSEVERIGYLDGKNEVVVLFYKVGGIGHMLSVDPGSGQEQGGAEGAYAIDNDFFSTYYIAKDFGLID